MAQRYDQDAILAYVEDEMSGDARRAFEQQLEQDAALRQLVTDLIADRQGLQSLRRDTAPPGLVDAAIGHLERRMLLDADPQAEQPPQLAGPMPIGRARHRRMARTRWLAYAAVAAGLLLSGAVMWQTLVVPPQPQATRLAEAEQPDPDPPQRPATDSPAIAATEPPAGSALAAAEADDMSATSEPVMSLARAKQAEATSRGMAGRVAGNLAMDAALADADTPALEQEVTASAQPAQAQPEPEAVASADAAEPQLRVQVSTTDSAWTQQQVMRWAVANRAVVVTPLPVSRSGDRVDVASACRTRTAAVGELAPYRGERDDAYSGLAMRADEAPSPAGRQQTVMVKMAESQVGSLLAHLNAAGTQRAQVVEPRQSQITVTPYYDLNWGSLLNTQVSLAPVTGGYEPDAALLPPRQVNVLLELNEQTAPALDAPAAQPPQEDP